MKVLGIETSCDETAAAVVEGNLNSAKPLRIISSVVASSAELHAKYGGIIPEQAARQQVKVMIPTLWECLQQMNVRERSQIDKSDLNKLRRYGTGVDAIAITVGPGLMGSLLVGVETARTLAYLWQKPIIPANHLVAHLYANWIERSDSPSLGLGTSTSKESEGLPKFPAVGLVVSGGHTDMVLMRDHKHLKLIGSTRDDAAGECFDKCARMLGLPYPGGPEIARLAERYSSSLSLSSKREKLKLFPRPLADQDNFDWSFSGLKTSVLYYLQKIQGGKVDKIRRYGAENAEQEELESISAEIQEAICDSLINKLTRSIEKFKPRSVLVAGGVAANKRLTEKLRELNQGAEWKLLVPPSKLCTDNGSYIAAYAFYHHSPIDWRKIRVDPGLTIMGPVKALRLGKELV